jgi:hypothetical protein
MFIKAQGVAGQHGYLASIKSEKARNERIPSGLPPESRYR